MHKVQDVVNSAFNIEHWDHVQYCVIASIVLQQSHTTAIVMNVKVGRQGYHKDMTVCRAAYMCS